MADGAAAQQKRSKDSLVAEYKRLLQIMIDNRPSGMRLKIAEALGKHKSFVSQITNPAYAVPVPARHLETIFKICHFSAEEREIFLAAYRQAHPGRAREIKTEAEAVTPARPRRSAAQSRILKIELPDLGDPERQRQIEELIQDFAHRVALLAGDRD